MSSTDAASAHRKSWRAAARRGILIADALVGLDAGASWRSPVSWNLTDKYPWAMPEEADVTGSPPTLG